MQTFLFKSEIGEEIISPFDNDSNINDVLKFVNFVSLNKNGGSSNIFKTSKVNEMSISALKATSQYSAPMEHKLNITK